MGPVAYRDLRIQWPERPLLETSKSIGFAGLFKLVATAPLTSIDLSAFDILVYGDGMVAFGPVTQPVLDSLRDFVYEGGGPLLMSDIKILADM